MSLENVKAHFRTYNKEQDILEFDTSSATVELAAQAVGTIPARIAKTLSFRNDDGGAILVVAAGDARIDNKKFREVFGYKARMLTPEEVVHFTGHEIGGVCPFGLVQQLNIYLDVSMKRFETVFPACGSLNSAIELTCDEMYQYAGRTSWVDVCKDWSADQQSA